MKASENNGLEGRTELRPGTDTAILKSLDFVNAYHPDVRTRFHDLMDTSSRRLVEEVRVMQPLLKDAAPDAIKATLEYAIQETNLKRDIKNHCDTLQRAYDTVARADQIESKLEEMSAREQRMNASKEASEGEYLRQKSELGVLVAQLAQREHTVAEQEARFKIQREEMQEAARHQYRVMVENLRASRQMTYDAGLEIARTLTTLSTTLANELNEKRKPLEELLPALVDKEEHAPALTFYRHMAELPMTIQKRIDAELNKLNEVLATFAPPEQTGTPSQAKA